MPLSFAPIADATHALMEWLRGSPSEGGEAFLSSLFALNASFASFDPLTAWLTQSLRRDISKLTAKYTREWLDKITNDIPKSDIDGKERIGTLVDEVIQLDEKIINLFSELSLFWKGAMGVCAVALLVSMAHPCYRRTLLLLALPAPLFVAHCRIRAWLFRRKARRKCEKIETGVAELRAKHHPATGNGDALVRINERLGRLEDRFAQLLSALEAK